MLNLAQQFRNGLDRFIALAPLVVTVTEPDGTVKYTCQATGPIRPRVTGTVNSYDQTQWQYTQRASDGVPQKFDLLVIDGAPRAIEEVRAVHVGGELIQFRILVKG